MNRCVIKDVAMNFAVELQKTNPRFDVQRFVSACTEGKSSCKTTHKTHKTITKKPWTRSWSVQPEIGGKPGIAPKQTLAPVALTCATLTRPLTRKND